MVCEGGCVTEPCTYAETTAAQKQLMKTLTQLGG